MSSAAEHLPIDESVMPPLVGILGFATMTVRPGDTSAAQGIGDLTVVANANLISLIESAAIAALDEYCGTGISTILNSISFEAITSAAIGAELQASAECIAQEGEENNVLTFSCEIYEGERLVAKALQQRSTVERVTYLARTAAQKLFESK